MRRFDHLEYYVGDAISTIQIFKYGLGMNIIGESKHETGNHTYVSYVLETGDFKWVFTTPYNSEFQHPENKAPNPKFNRDFVNNFIKTHGNGVGVIGFTVDDAHAAYRISLEHGAVGALEPYEVKNDTEEGVVVLSEVVIYGDTRVRFVERRGYNGPFLPGYRAVEDPRPIDYRIRRMDHVVGNVYDLNKYVELFKQWFGFHRFAYFTKEDIQTEWTALNSTVMSNDFETILMPLNEHAPKKKESQITEYLKAYNGEGVQHIALFSSSVLDTIQMMRDAPVGFSFIPTPSTYYDDPKVIRLMNEHLSLEAQEQAKRFGLLIDVDDEGVLLQIFTKPLFDRPTIFVEIIQRICKGVVVDKAGCGGFGKGNFRALFESIERLQIQRAMLLDEQ